MIGVDIVGWLVGLIGALVAWVAIQSRSRQKDRAVKSEQRVDAIIEKRKTEDEVQKMDTDAISTEFGWLHEKRRGR